LGGLFRDIDGAIVAACRTPTAGVAVAGLSHTEVTVQVRVVRR